jgi:hypothetical protein
MYTPASVLAFYDKKDPQDNKLCLEEYLDMIAAIEDGTFM